VLELIDVSNKDNAFLSASVPSYFV